MKEMTYEDLVNKYNELVEKYNLLANRYNGQAKFLERKCKENLKLIKEIFNFGKHSWLMGTNCM